MADACAHPQASMHAVKLAHGAVQMLWENRQQSSAPAHSLPLPEANCSAIANLPPLLHLASLTHSREEQAVPWTCSSSGPRHVAKASAVWVLSSNDKSEIQVDR